MSDAQIIYMVVQCGSFGLLALIVVWFGKVVIPSAMNAFTKFVADTRTDRQQDQERHDREMARRDAAQEKTAEALAQVSEALTDVANRLERLEDRTAEHRPIFERGDDPATRPDTHGRRRPA